MKPIHKHPKRLLMPYREQHRNQKVNISKKVLSCQKGKKSNRNLSLEKLLENLNLTRKESRIQSINSPLVSKKLHQSRFRKDNRHRNHQKLITAKAFPTSEQSKPSSKEKPGPKQSKHTSKDKDEILVLIFPILDTSK